MTNTKTMNFILLIAASMLLHVGCANMSGLQTGRVVPKGQAEINLGVGTYNSKAFSEALEEDTEGTVELDEVSSAYGEINYRQGVAENWDAGLKLTLIGTAQVDAKYQFVKSEGNGFDMAAGLGLGHMEIKSGSGDEEVKTTMIDVVLPLYMSYNISDNFAVYLNPKYIVRNIKTDNDSGSTSLYGGAAGVKIGKDWGCYLETAYQKAAKGDFTAQQFTGSFFWNTSSTWF
jgi:hypothetical protein